MSNELESYQGGDLAPYGTGTGLQPYSPQDDWGNTDADYLAERPAHAFAPDVAPEMVPVLREIGAVISGDLLRLGHPVAWVNAALDWHTKHFGTTPTRVQRRHNFNLHAHAGDALAESFGNAMARAGVNQEFISNSLWLLEEMVRRLTAGNGVPAHAGAPTSGSASAILDSLDDKTFAYVERHNQNVASQTEAYLRGKYGDAYPQVIATANKYLANLPESDRAFFDAFEPNSWTLSLNSATTVEGLYRNAVGGHNLPSGSALATEIAQIENLMRTNRKAYNNDIQLQSRYRTLLELRGH